MLVAARALTRALVKKLKAVKSKEVAAQLQAIERALQAALKQGKPWQARGKLEAHEFLFEGPTLLLLLALLDELPTLTGGLATERPAGREHQVIATAAQIRRAQTFLKKL